MEEETVKSIIDIGMQSSYEDSPADSQKSEFETFDFYENVIFVMMFFFMIVL